MNKGSVSRFLIYVVLFLMGVIGIACVVIKPSLFMTNPYFNGSILCIWLLGVGVTLNALLGLWREEGIFHQKPHRFLKILRPLVQLYERAPNASRPTMEQALDRCYQGMNQDVLRYMAGSLIFLGLLGTLWGLSETIVAISDVIGHLPSQDAAEGFLETLKTQLQQPLAGMGVAFSSSLLGVAGTLTMGFLIVQLDRAKDVFFQKAEVWAANLFKSQDFATGSGLESNLDVSLAHWAEGVERLGRLYVGAEKRQQDLLNGVIGFGEKTQNLLELMKVQNFVTNKWAEEQMHTRQVLERISQKMQEMTFGGDEGVKSSLGKIAATSGEILRHMADHSLVDTVRKEVSVQRRLDAQKPAEKTGHSGEAHRPDATPKRPAPR